MKVLFVCGVKINDAALSCASWIKSLLGGIRQDIEIAVFSPASGSAADAQTVTYGKRTLKVFFSALSETQGSLFQVIEKERPDAVVIFGTETPYTLPAVKACERADVLESTFLFAQGLACACARHYSEGVPGRIIRRKTLRDFLRRENIRKEQMRLEERAMYEQQAIESIRRFIGRTTIDKAVLRMYNPTARYCRCSDVLRDSFYDGVWRYDACEKHRIFISQYYYPLKGFHYLLEAVSVLKDKYPDIRIAAAGYNPIRQSVTENELKDSSYIRYLKFLIRKYGLADHIELLGELSEERMKEEYLKANVFVLPSTIENSPNSLAEAMMLGVPCVASDVGGVTDLALHGKEAYIYPSSAVYLLSYYLDTVFSDIESTEKLALSGRERAKREYDREKNIKTFETILEEAVKKS